MGYYTRTTAVDFTIPADKVDDAYKAVCALNWRNDLKRGGRYPQEPGADDSQPRPDKWFSWMDWNYHETCKELKEVMEALGFEDCSMTEQGFDLGWYDSKTGNEDCFIEALAPFADPGSYINWQGEDSEDRYRWEVRGGELIRMHAAAIEWIDD
jgi:hypothetical protein